MIKEHCVTHHEVKPAVTHLDYEIDEPAVPSVYGWVK